MRMTLYYLLHSVKNQIRKIFKTWVAIFLLVCVLGGALVGVAVGAIMSLAEGEPEMEESGTVEGGDFEELPPDAAPPMSEEEKRNVTELVVALISLLMLVTAVLFADKSGGSIFLMPDVNLLFPAPMRPQSVLTFRLVMQMGTMLLATAYLLFQIPSMLLAAGFSGLAIFAALMAWIFLLVFTKLVSVMLYTATGTNPALKRYIRPVVFGALFLLGAAFYVTVGEDKDYLAAAFAFFNAPVTRYIPLWGWLKAMVVFAMEGNVGGMLAASGALLLLAVVAVLVIWRMRADFYEDAMTRTEELAERQQAQMAAQTAQRKKDRSEKLRREGFSRGAGATVYFHKVLYNRFRFAILRVFTKTSLTYLTIAVGTALLMLFGKLQMLFPVIPLILSVMTFFRALGNPIATDVEKESFFLVPDTAHRKVAFAFLGGVVNSALDLLPALLAAGIMMAASPLEWLMWYLAAVSIGAYSDSIGVLIDLSLSTALSLTVRSFVQIIFIYFGLVPAGVMIALGFVLGKLWLFLLLTVLFNIIVTAVALFIAPLFVMRGRR